MAVQVRFASLQITKVLQLTMIPQLCPQDSYGRPGALCQPPSYQSIAIYNDPSALPPVFLVNMSSVTDRGSRVLGHMSWVTCLGSTVLGHLSRIAFCITYMTFFMQTLVIDPLIEKPCGHAHKYTHICNEYIEVWGRRRYN